MALHLYLTCPSQQEQIAESGITAVTYAHVQTAAHDVGQHFSEQGTARVVVDIGYHGLTMTVVETDRVVVVVVEKRLLIPADEGIVLLALFLRQASYQRALAVMLQGLLAQPSRRLCQIDRYRPIC